MTPELPDPAARARFQPTRGVAVEAGGATWLLGRLGTDPAFDEIKERLYAGAMTRGEVERADVHVAAFYMVGANYDVTPDEARAVVLSVPPADLAAAVAESIFAREDLRRSYGEWERAALISNGIDPKAVPADALPHVLRMLVMSGRAPEADEYTEAGEARQKFAGLLAIKDGRR